MQLKTIVLLVITALLALTTKYHVLQEPTTMQSEERLCQAAQLPLLANIFQIQQQQHCQQQLHVQLDMNV